MPLKAGNSRATIATNIREMQAAGHPHAQAVAASLHNADKYQHRAVGGLNSPPPFWERNEARQLNDQPHFGGLFKSNTAGRTDRLPHSVPADSFVFPADVVSSLGQGNTLAGSKILDSMLGTAPYGAKMPKPAHLSFPHVAMRGRESGGDTPQDEPGVSHVMVAGGEWMATPDKLAVIGRRRRAAKMSKARSDLAAGHEWARNLVTEVRKHQKKFLASAPPPKR